MNGRILEKVDIQNDLGVLMDSELKFHHQTSSAVKKANQISKRHSRQKMKKT